MLPTYAWRLTYADGRTLSNEEVSWPELADLVSLPQVGGLSYTVSVLREPAAQLTAYAGGRAHTLRAPGEQGRFYRELRLRAPLASGADPQVLYHAIGYIDPLGGRVVLEIDPRGNTQTRLVPPIAPEAS